MDLASVRQGWEAVYAGAVAEPPRGWPVAPQSQEKRPVGDTPWSVGVTRNAPVKKCTREA